MAKTKLTLSIDRHVVQRAKAFATKHDTSISELVERFLKQLEREGRRNEVGATPMVSRLRGISRPSGGREEYRRHLEEKYGR